jgi:GT2 family glycosyltransferase/glycosyltransferase involved in cell wall biosynthesis
MREQPAVVFLGTIEWTGRWQRGHHFARELARRGHRVVYVDPTLEPGAPGRRVVPAEHVPEGVTVVRLPSATSHFIWQPPTAADRAAMLGGLTAMIDEEILRCPIMFVESPFWQPLLGLLREATDFPVVYDCLDLHEEWPIHDAERIRADERELAGSADLVLASSPPLVEHMSRFNANVLHVGNACDPEHFRPRPGDQGPLRPPIRGPIVGFIGDMSDYSFDVDLVAALAEAGAGAGWTIVLVGPVNLPELPARLDPLPNVVRVGTVPYSELPRYVAEFDVAIIPFLVNDLTAAVDPVKAWEYLAAGKPVVATPIEPLYPLQGLVELAAVDEFAAAVTRAIEHPGDADERIAAASTVSWHDRVESFHPELLACAPSLDIVVVSFDNAGPLERCLDSIERDESYPAHLIVVDNASGDATQAVLDRAESHGATVIRNESNAGYPAAVNQGVAAGRGAYVLLLNDDVQMPDGGALALVHSLARSRSTGIAGPVTNRIGNEAMIDVPYDRPDPHPAQVDGMHRQRLLDWRGVRFEYGVAALFAAILRRADLHAVGGLAEHYDLGQFEDDELSERLRRRGLRVICCEDVFVHHVGRTSFDRLERDHYDDLFGRNRRIFESTMGIPWRPHRPRGADHRPPARGTV